MLYSLIIYFLVIEKKLYFFIFNVPRCFALKWQDFCSLFIFLGELINYPKVKSIIIILFELFVLNLFLGIIKTIRLFFFFKNYSACSQRRFSENFLLLYMMRIVEATTTNPM